MNTSDKGQVQFLKKETKMKDKMKNLTENKLILLYILKNMDLLLTNSQLTEIVMQDSLMNYFLLQQYLLDLMNIEYIQIISENNKQFYKITKQGEEALNYFEKRISYVKREKILNRLSDKRKGIKQASEISSDYTPYNENDYCVECKIIENRTPLIELKVSVGSKAQAKKICEEWKKNSQIMYSKIISVLTEEPKTDGNN
jgi:predicted transcriptional regulator